MLHLSRGKSAFLSWLRRERLWRLGRRSRWQELVKILGCLRSFFATAKLSLVQMKLFCTLPWAMIAPCTSSIWHLYFMLLNFHDGMVPVYLLTRLRAGTACFTHTIGPCSAEACYIVGAGCVRWPCAQTQAAGSEMCFCGVERRTELTCEHYARHLRALSSKLKWEP